MAFLAQHCGSDFSGFSKKRSKALQQVGDELLQVEFAGEVGGFGNDEVVSVRERLTKGIDTRSFRSIAHRVELGDLGFELVLSGHREKCTVRRDEMTYDLFTALHRKTHFGQSRPEVRHPVSLSFGGPYSNGKLSADRRHGRWSWRAFACFL